MRALIVKLRILINRHPRLAVFLAGFIYRHPRLRAFLARRYQILLPIHPGADGEPPGFRFPLAATPDRLSARARAIVAELQG